MPDTVILKCVSRYRSSKGEYDVGQEIHLFANQAAALMRDSPGSFVRVEDLLPAEVKKVADTITNTETKEGMVAVDRRARGGRRRAKKV
jgi:hypothetical protein